MPAAVVFFLDDEQQKIVEGALSRACANRLEKTKAQKRAAAITNIAERYLRSVDLIRNPDLQELDSCLPRNDKI